VNGTQHRAIVLAGLLAVAAACGHSPTAPSSDLLQVNGSMRFQSVEAGFWAVRGDDGVLYDPVGGVPGAFQREGMRVFLEAKRRDDLGGTHMVGPLVEIIRLLPL
jgi:hypothetical protein